MDAPWRSPPPDEASDSSSVVPGSPMPATPLHGEGAESVLGSGEQSPAWAQPSPAWAQSPMPESPQLCAYPRVLVVPEGGQLRFDVTTEAGQHALRSHLAQYGYAIAADCASA